MASIKNGEVIGALMALKELGPKDLPAPTALRVVKLYKKLAEQHEDVSKVAQTVREKYGEKDEAGKLVQGEQGEGSVKIPTDVKEEFEAAITALYDDTFETDLSLSITAFGDVKVSPAIIGSLGDLISE